MDWLWLLALAPPVLGLAATGHADVPDGAQSDRAQILEHIHGIFRAYIAGDRAAIRRAHTPDWVGFQGPSTGIERGLDAYMVNAERSLRAFRGTGYELLDAEVSVFGDFAVVFYVGRYDYRDQDGAQGSLPLRSVDLYRREPEGWIQFGSHITPIPSGGPWGAAGSR